MTPEDFGLVRRAVEWRRANGWMFGFYPTRGEAAWKSDRWLVEADIYPDDVRLSVDDETSRRLSLQASSVREAVDVLCALGVLPVTFSSAWRAAQEATSVAYKAGLEAGRESIRREHAERTQGIYYGTRRPGYLSVRHHPEATARSLVKQTNGVVELVSRPVFRWERVSDV